MSVCYVFAMRLLGLPRLHRGQPRMCPRVASGCPGLCPRCVPGLCPRVVSGYSVVCPPGCVPGRVPGLPPGCVPGYVRVVSPGTSPDIGLNSLKLNIFIMITFPPPRKNSSLFSKQERENAKKVIPMYTTNVKSKKYEHITIKNMKVGMLIKKQNHRQLYEIVKILRVNVHILPHPSLPYIDVVQKVKKNTIVGFEIYKYDK